MQRRDFTTALGLGVVAAAAYASTPASAQQAAGGKSRLAQILERGTVRIGTTGDFNPMSFRDPGSNEYKGFDIEAMTQFAADTGVKIEWVAAEWATLVAGIASNRFDIFSGASVSMARRQDGGLLDALSRSGDRAGGREGGRSPSSSRGRA